MEFYHWNEIDIYDQFIDYLKKLALKGLDLNEGVKKHHIFPKHAGGSDERNNIVLVSTKNHTLAHFYRFLAYKEKGDWVTYIMRKDRKTNSRERSLLTGAKNKKAGILFWSKDWQSQ
jgi:hypothetical protein